MNDKMKVEGLSEEIKKLRNMIDALSSPPNTIGTFLGITERNKEGYGQNGTYEQDGTCKQTREQTREQTRGKSTQKQVGQKQTEQKTEQKSKTRLGIVAVDGRIQLVGINNNLSAKDLRIGSGVCLSQTNAILDKFDHSVGAIVAIVGKQIGEGKFEVHENGSSKYIAENLAEKKLSVGDSVIIDNSKSFILVSLGKDDSSLYTKKAPKVEWEDVGGQEEAIEQLKDNFETPMRYRAVYKKHGINTPKGAFLFGPPGCGKTLLARALAYNLGLVMNRSESNGYLYVVDGSTFFQKYVGVGEEMIRAIYATAKMKAKEKNGVSVIVIDEADSAFRKRGTSISQDASDSLVNTLLGCIDGFEPADNVVTCMMSNRPELLDDAIVRDGRIGINIHVKRPEFEGTKKIFEIYLKKIKQSLDYAKLALHGAECVFGSEILSENVSGALVESIVNHTKMIVAKKEIESGKQQSIQERDITDSARYFEDMRKKTRDAFRESRTASTIGPANFNFPVNIVKKIRNKEVII